MSVAQQVQFVQRSSRGAARAATPNITQKKSKLMLNPEEYGKQSSVYMARKERLESEKDIAQLLNRINLLRKEEERNAKRIEETTKKTDEVQQHKRQKDEETRRRLRQQIQEEEFLRFMQHKQLELRKQQQNERVAIRNALVEYKKEEREEVKRMSRVNSERIRGGKSKEFEQKLKKHDYLQNKKHLWKQKVSSFWEERIQKQQEENQQVQFEEIKLKYRNEKIVDALEREEIQLIRRLQHSQTLAETALARLDDAQKLNQREFEEKYGRPQQQYITSNTMQNASLSTFGASTQPFI